MATKLSDLQPGEVSLVRRGANRRPFALWKSDELEIDETVAKILEEPAENEEQLLDAIRKAGGEDDVLLAAAAYARLRESLPVELRKAMDDADEGDDTPADDMEPDDEAIAKTAAVEEPIYKRDFTAEQRRELAKKGHALSDGSYPIETAADIGPAVTLASSGHGDVEAAKALIKRRAAALGATAQLPESWKVNKEDDMTDTPVVPIQKEDGTWDLSAVPEDQRAGYELMLKAHEDQVAELQKAAEANESKADEAIKIAKAEQEKRETSEYIAKSAELDQLAKNDEEFGPVLREIAKAEEAGHLSEGTSEALDSVLKAANEAVKTADIFKEAGRVGRGNGGDADSKLDAAAAEIRKADPSLTEEQAVAKALENDPSLYEDIRKEQQ